VGRKTEEEVRSSSKADVLEGICTVKSAGRTEGTIKAYWCLLR